MKNTFLICAFPRSRTLWLSHWLSVLPVASCTHEATEYAGSAEHFWRNAETFSNGCDYYGNSDSANIFVLPALLAERPLTRVVWIGRSIVEVAHSMKRAGLPFNESSARTLMGLRDRYSQHFDLVINYEDLETMTTCRTLWEFCLPGVPFDIGRWGIYHPKNISYTKENPPPVKKYDLFLDWVHRELKEPARKEQ